MDGGSMNPRQVIDDIRQNKYGIGSDGRQREDFKAISSDLKSAIAQLSTGLYGEDVHFFLELIQNAEDNRYAKSVLPDLKFVLLDKDPTNTPDSDGCLCVLNNELGFGEANVRSVCATGKSTKTKKDGYIGEKGIGFKSVFTVTDEPHIFSNGYQFKFKGEDCDPSIELAFVVPYWIDDIPQVARQSGYTTCLLLPIKTGQRETIETELARIAPESILFLSHLENLSVDLEASNHSISLIRDASAAPLVDLLVIKDGQDEPLLKYWVTRKEIVVPADVNETKRDQITEREIVVAFPLTQKDSPGTLYAYLPTGVQSGLPFLVNADFLLTANRESIQINKPWNLWLRDAIADVVVQGLLELANDRDHQHRVCWHIPIKKQLKALDDFLKPVCKLVADRLSDERVVLVSNGEMIKAGDVRQCNRVERGLFQSSINRISFNKFKLIDERLDPYRQQLQAIGVRELKLRDIKACLEDQDWLAEQDAQWFFELYDYLRSSSRLTDTSFDKFALSRLENGLALVGVDTVYLPPNDPAELDRVKSLTDSRLPSVDFIDLELYRLVQENAEILAWCQSKLGWLDFSYSGYVINSLLPALSGMEQLEADLLLSVTKALMYSWKELNDEAKGAVRRLLPVVLDSGEISFRHKIHFKTFVTPRHFDPENGWQKIFSGPEECEHFYVLSESYLQLPSESDGELLPAFFKWIGVTDHPPLRSLRFRKYEDGGAFREYCSAVWGGFSEYSSNIPVLDSLVPPLSFLDEKNIKSRAYKEIWIKWLETDIKQTPTSREASFTRLGVINYYYYNKKRASVASGIKFYLDKLPWLRTTKGYKRPSEIFLPKQSIKEIFGNSLPYLNEEMSPELCALLGIKSEANQDSVVEYLKELSSDPKVDAASIKRIYKYLAQYGEGLEQLFRDDRLIYIQTTLKWYSADEVVWEDESTVFGELYGWLSPDYENTNLRDFFTRKLGVKSAVDPQALANAWLQLIGSKSSDVKEIELKLTKIIPRLLSLVKSDDPLPEWWDGFSGDVRLWTQDDNFVDRDALYFSDNRYLSNLFSNDIYLAWIPDSGNAVSFYSPLFETLGVQPISAAVRQYGVVPEDAEAASKPVILTRHSKRLLAYLVRNDFPERFAELVSEGPLGSLLRSVETNLEEIEILYRLDDQDIEHSVTDRHGFCDLTTQAVLTKTESDIDEIKDDVAEFIARAIWGTRYRDGEDKIKAILSVGSDARYRKLRDKKDWSMPREVMGLVESYIDESALLLETHEFPEPTVTPTVEKPASQLSDDTPSEGSGSGSTGEPEPRTGGQSDENRGTTQPSGQTHGRTGSAGGNRTRSSGAQGNRSRGAGSSGEKPSSAPSGRKDTQRAASGSTSRSREKSREYNASNQRRVVTYVYPEAAIDNPRTEAEIEKQRHDQQERQSIGDAAEEFALECEKNKGLTARRMPPNNRGYDIESVNADNGEVRLIEVKGVDGPWGSRGVGLSAPQFEMALNTGEGYWLYVVEYARSDSQVLHRINDPAHKIGEFRFDDGWRGLHKEEPQKPDESDKTLLETLLELTADDDCREIIKYCAENKLPVPEVGYELLDNRGAVAFEFELAWEDSALAVVIDDADALSSEPWTVLIASNVDSVKRELARAYNLTAED